MSKKNILILGYFGYQTNQLDGQTVKTRDIKKLMEKYSGKNKLKYFDTQLLQKNKFYYFQLLWLLFWCKHLIYLPGKNNLSKLSRFLELLIKIKKIDIYHIVVGGWLSEFLLENKWLVSLLQKFKFIGVESVNLTEELSNNFSLKNVKFFPNFRIHDYIPPSPIADKPLKLVFMARVMREKGVDTLFKLAKIIDDNNFNVAITFYGPIAKEDDDFFQQGIKTFKSVEYKGVLEPHEINQTLSNYDALILPTRYEGEGFPGSILDAYISGIPVIVSKWKFIPEFVEDGVTGFVVHNIDDLVEKVIYLESDKEKLIDMKKNAHKKSHLYSSETAWSILKSEIFG